MTHNQLKQMLWDTARPREIDENDLAICQNPQCQDCFVPEEDDDEALLCPRCAESLPAVEVSNIRYAIQHGLSPEVYGE